MSTTNNSGDDPFYLWRARATLLAPKMKLDAYLINETVGIINTVFGENWLQTEGLRKDLGTVLGSRVHPIGNCLQAVWERQVAELVELAEYLKFAAPSQNFSKLASCLKGDYRSTRLQLAYAYRLHRFGVEHVEFEPPVAAGRYGDIEFTYKGKGYLVECFVPRVQAVDNSQEQFERLVKQALDAVKDLSITVSIAIQLLRSINVHDRQENVRCVQSLAAELERSTKSSSSLSGALLRQTSSALISVALSVPVAPGKESIFKLHPSFPEPDGNPHIFMRIGLAPENITGVQVSEYSMTTHSHVGIWLTAKEKYEQSIRKDLEKPLMQLVKKLKKKIAQTKRGPDWGRLLLVQTWIASEFDRIRQNQLDNFKREMFASGGLSAVLLVSRKWDGLKFRHTWTVRLVLPHNRQSDLWEVLSGVSQLGSECLVPQVII